MSTASKKIPVQNHMLRNLFPADVPKVVSAPAAGKPLSTTEHLNRVQ